MMSDNHQQEQKRQVAEAALEWVRDGSVLGVGTGSTVNCFIEALGESRIRLEAAVSSSEATTALLQGIGVDVVDLNQAGTLDLYVDNVHLVPLPAPAILLVLGAAWVLRRR